MWEIGTVFFLTTLAFPVLAFMPLVNELFASWAHTYLMIFDQTAALHGHGILKHELLGQVEKIANVHDVLQKG